jgi:hypothetical protein
MAGYFERKALATLCSLTSWRSSLMGSLASSTARRLEAARNRFK